jgi:pyridoxal phosphate enzyme (YggS family)
MPTIQQNLSHIHQQIQTYELRYHRTPNSVKLLAVSKNHPIEKIQDAINAGQLAFGENYLQEALGKIETLNNKNLEWHFIGPIQSNKTKKIAEHFDWVHSVDSLRIAKRLNDQRPANLPPLNICLEINISHETTKSGILPEDALSLAQTCLTLPQLKLRGLMAIPAPKKNFPEQRAELHKLKLLYDHLQEKGLNLDTLSMGMSDDMEAAIAENATMVRIGTAIFGQRNK